MKKLFFSIVITIGFFGITNAQDETFDTLTSQVGDDKYVEI